MVLLNKKEIFIKEILFIISFVICTISVDTHVLDECPLIDGHNDLAYNLFQRLRNDLSSFKFSSNLKNDPSWKNCTTCHTDLPRLRHGKVGGVFWAAYVPCKTQYKDAVAKTLEQIDVIKRLVFSHPSDLQLVTSVDGIWDAFFSGRIASLIGVEGGHSIDSRLGVLRMFYDLGVRYLTLTHTCNTPWADNSNVDYTGPVLNLTSFGKKVVFEMNRLGMMVDLSHVSHNVMNEVINISRAPVIFSHSSIYRLCQHHRNVQDDTLELLKRNNGIIMINFYSGFINNDTNRATIDDVVKHINYVVDKIGIEYVGLGSDFDGVNKLPEGLEDVSKYPDLFDRLRELNCTRWTKRNLSRLAGENLLRVFSNVEKIRDSLKYEKPEQKWIPERDLEEMDDISIANCRTYLTD